MIHFAEKGGELLTVERRVNKAMMKVKSDRSFTEEQNKWLDLIRRHLIENLLMEKEDIEMLPIFTREGASWSKLNKVFKGKLETIIHEINEAIAA
jgi:type I restriction enzyme R subunit